MSLREAGLVVLMRANGQCRIYIYIFFCIVLVKEVATFLKNTQLPEGAIRVTPQWRGRPEAFILKKDRSRSWRRKLRASAEVLNEVFWAAQWYAALFPYELMVLVPCNCRKHRVIHVDSQKVFLEVCHSTWMSPSKSWQFGVIMIIVLLGILNFAFSGLLLGEFLTVDEISNLTVIASLFSRVFFSIFLSVLANCMSFRGMS